MTIIIDTGVFYAYMDKKDDHHFDSVALLHHSLEGRFGTVFTSDYVALETTLLIRNRFDSALSLSFLDFLKESGLVTIAVGEENYPAATEVMRENFPRLSLCDSATLVLMNSFGIHSLASFDERSFGGSIQNIRGKNYFESLPDSEKATMKREILERGDKGDARGPLKTSSRDKGGIGRAIR